MRRWQFDPQDLLVLHRAFILLGLTYESSRDGYNYYYLPGEENPLFFLRRDRRTKVPPKQVSYYLNCLELHGVLETHFRKALQGQKVPKIRTLFPPE